MKPYLVGITASVFIFITIGMVAGNKVKDSNDYYVAGRRAPVVLIVGSLIASFLSTGAFLGDTGEVYSGFFMGIVIVGIIQSSGYVYGAGLFGKYIRRANVNTVPEYFGRRFDSNRLRKLASATMIVAVTAYLLSAMQGVSTLMIQITGLDYKVCIILSWLAFTIFTVYSGSMGVLITDTIMFLVFLTASLIGIPFIIKAAGGWNAGITALATSTTNPGIISWTNNLSYLYPTGMQNLIWAVVYGIVWAIVVMVSPWQSSRYLMAKNEHTVMRASVFASMGVASVTMALYFSAVFIYKINPNISEASTSVIWAAINCMPMVVGVVMLTGILSAGISSASTFLSLIGTSLTNDILKKNNVDDIKNSLKISRAVTGGVSILVLAIAFFNPPQIFWIMYFGGTVIASAWGIVAIASVWWKNMSETGAFLGMLLGFAGCVTAKIASALIGKRPPIYLDPFFVGIVCSIIGIIIGNYIRNATEADIQRYEKLHIRPDIEGDESEDKKTHNLMWIYLAFGFLIGLVFVFAYAVPYLNAVQTLE